MFSGLDIFFIRDAVLPFYFFIIQLRSVEEDGLDGTTNLNR